MGTPLLFAGTMGMVMDDENATPGTRAFSLSACAGYVAVTVATVPAEPGQAHADQALDPA
jgi:hypothetical protein